LTWAHVAGGVNDTSPVQPSPRYGHTASWVGNRMVIIGGFVRPGLESMSNIWMWDPSSLSWTQNTCTGTVPQSRREHSAVVMDNQIVIFGGSDATHSKTFNDVAVLDVPSCKWSMPTIASDANAAPSGGRRAHTAAISHDNTQMLVFFGFTDEKNATATPPVMVLDMKNWKWSSQFLPGGTVADSQATSTIQSILTFIESNIIIISAFAGAALLLIIAIIVAVCIRNRIRRQEEVVFDPRRPLIPPSDSGPEKPKMAHVNEAGGRSDPGRLTVFSAIQNRCSKGGFLWFEEGGGGKSGAKVRKFFGVD